MRRSLKAKLESLPKSAGVYTFKDKKGKVIYVGKAKSLRSRVRSYFREADIQHPRTAVLVSRTHDLDFIVTRSEVEALILECNLIKYFKPRYNVNLKDDKKYPYIKVTSREPFPAVHPTRNLKHDGSRYFGPYTDAKAMRKSLKFLTDIFAVRTCRRKLPLRTPDRGCLNYHIGKCVGPCRGEVSREAYRALVHQVCQYLSGRMSDLIKDINAKMEEEASKLRFEEAAALRDTLLALEKVAQKQIMVSPRSKDRDVIAVRADSSQAVGFVLKVREGKLVGKEVYKLAFEGTVSACELIGPFLEQYLAVSTFVPAEILVEELPEGVPLIQRWLREKTGRQIKVLSPKKGKGRDLLKMAGDNARLILSQVAQAEKPAKRVASSIKELARWLGLPTVPVKIAAFDVSTIQGAQPVGSRVFFKNGRPAKSLYRRYAIQSVKGQDDFGMMKEILLRAWSHVEAQEEEAPDLVLIDGGKGQVSSALEGIRGAGCSPDRLPSVVGIAKRLDEIHVPGRSDPVQIPHDSPALRLLQRIRDEAHRFAVDYHREKRRRHSLRSRLEEIDGIGRVLSQRLLTKFGSVEGVRDADVGDIVKVKGMSTKKAEMLIARLRTG